MHTDAVVFDSPYSISVRPLDVTRSGPDDIVVQVRHSGISTGTERLLWSGRMPAFPGLGYPLVPGYETVGYVEEAGASSGRRVGETVFVPGARCFADARCLFGATARTLVTSGTRVVPVDETLGADAILLSLAATANHAIAGHALPDLIVGHGVVGRLLARLTVANGGTPTVWETNAERHGDGRDYTVLHPDDDDTPAYRTIFDASGDPDLLDTLIGRLAHGGEIVLAGFYAERLGFAFPPAFMKEARIRVAAEWRPEDMTAVVRDVANGSLSLRGLLTHTRPAREAANAYRTAFEDPACLKMALDWS